MNEKNPTPRIVFEFDKKSMEGLRYLKDMMELVDEEEREFANIIREGLRLLYFLVQKTREGYSQVILKNPDTESAKEIEIPFLKKFSELYKDTDKNI